MRFSRFSFALASILVVGLGVAPMNAQDPQRESSAQPKVDPFADPPASVTQATVKQRARPTSLQETLDRRFDFDFLETPLRDVVSYLEELTAIQFVLKTKTLEDAGVNPEKAITVGLKQVRLSTFLELLLDDFELTYIEKDDLIVITTTADAELTMIIRVYDCRDLLAMEAPPGSDKFVPAAAVRRGGFFAVDDNVKLAAGGSADSQPSRNAAPPAGGFGGAGLGSEAVEPVSEHDLRARRLMNLLTANVDPNSWDEVGGPGSISEFNGLIVVSQTARTHMKVERTLDMLRQAAGLETAKGKVVR